MYFTGTEVVYDLDQNGPWIWVEIGTQSGYMSADYLYWGSDFSNLEPQQPTGVVTNVKAGSWVNLRADASQQSEAVIALHKDDAVTVLGETASKWYYVTIGGVYGYVMEAFLQMGVAQPKPKPRPRIRPP